MVGTAILIIEIVGMLPNIKGKEGAEAAGDGVAGARFLRDHQCAVRSGGQPDPAGAEKADAFRYELGFEGVDASPLFDDPGE